MGRYWHEKTEVLERKLVTVPLSPVQIPYGLSWYRKLSSTANGRTLTAWTMMCLFHMWNCTKICPVGFMLFHHRRTGGQWLLFTLRKGLEGKAILCTSIHVRVSSRISSHFHPSMKINIHNQFQVPAALSMGKSRNRRVGGHLGRAAGFGEEKNPLYVPGIETLFLRFPVRIKTELFELSNTPGIETLFLGFPVSIKTELFELSNTAAE